MAREIVYDVVVVGSGLSGIFGALALRRKGLSVLIVEATSEFGGCSRRRDSAPLFRFLPANEATEKGLRFLKELPGFESLSWSSKQVSPLTERDHELVPFIDFGDSTPEFYKELSYFLHHSHLSTSIPLETWAEVAMRGFDGDLWLQSQLTRIDTDAGRVTGVWINAQKHVRCSAVFFTPSPMQLASLFQLPDQVSRLKNDFSIQKLVTCLQIDVGHESLPDSLFSESSTETPILCLGYLSGSDPLPCIGRFVKDEKPYSQWMAFIPEDAAEDTDFVGECLRKMRRAMRRIHGDLWSQPSKEKISVHSAISFLGNLRSKDGVQSSLIKGLYFGFSGISDPGNIVGSLVQVAKVTEVLSSEVASQAPRTPNHPAAEGPSSHSHKENDVSL